MGKMPTMRSSVTEKYSPDAEAGDSKSAVSHKSTQSSRSSVLERAREYNRRIDEQNMKRAKSMERSSDTSSTKSPGGTPRSASAGRSGPSGNRISTRERAMASVRNEKPGYAQTNGVHHHGNNISTSSSHSEKERPSKSRASTSNSRNQNASSRRPEPTTPQSSTNREKSNNVGSKGNPSNGRSAAPPSRKPKEEEQEAIVTPELLVDALSGHEDGLLAIAERLMEHYDRGYDVMGEAIIDAFADVQKLFQHVVEAAHMEGAAFEASRREQEMTELRKQVNGEIPEEALAPPSTPNGTAPTRHDEFIDQDVKDLLTEAIRKGASLRDNNQHKECYQLYESACNSASSLLPVDSDHRGRLQLSIARAESMTPDRGCAILRYAMDDVLRSGLRAGKTILPDPSKRGDCVLSKPKDHPSLNGSMGQTGVVQSSEEALASLVEEMKEVLGAPVYDNTPLQTVANRFWLALGDAQRSQLKNEERLEQNLGKLKGEFLLARAEWEERLTQSQDQIEVYKRKYSRLKEHSKGENYMEQARSMSAKWTTDGKTGDGDPNMSYDSASSRMRSQGPGSVASLGSGLAQQARSIVGSFSCSSGLNERSGVLEDELSGADRYVQESRSYRSRERIPTSRTLSGSNSVGTTATTPNRQRRQRSAGRREAYHHSTADV